MSSENVNSKPGSGTTWPSARLRPDPTSEAGYLAQQAADAKAAIRQTAHVMGKGVIDAANEHPLVALGLAAVTGALAARIVTAGSGNGKHEPRPKPPSFLDDFIAGTIQPMIPNLLASVLAVVCPPPPAPKSGEPPATNGTVG